jgi:hypothetical protein
MHCCVCNIVCFHIGEIQLCDYHKVYCCVYHQTGAPCGTTAPVGDIDRYRYEDKVKQGLKDKT